MPMFGKLQFEKLESREQERGETGLWLQTGQ